MEIVVAVVGGDGLSFSEASCLASELQVLDFSHSPSRQKTFSIEILYFFQKLLYRLPEHNAAQDLGRPHPLVGQPHGSFHLSVCPPCFIRDAWFPNKWGPAIHRSTFDDDPAFVLGLSPKTCRLEFVFCVRWLDGCLVDPRFQTHAPFLICSDELDKLSDRPYAGVMGGLGL